MNYVILHYFFMVHLCNIKMSANTIRHKSNNNFDIDDFINQLLTSQKFDELAEKVADKAASKIKGIDTSPTRLERFIDGNKLNKSSEALQNYRDQSRESNRDYDKESNLFSNNIKLRNDNQSGKEGKIDTHAVMDETTSQSESLRLKYKYLTRNAYEKKVFNDRASDNTDRNSVPRNDKNEDTSMQKVKQGPEEFQEHDSKTEGRLSNQDATEKNQYGSKNDFEEINRWRHEARDDDRKDSESNRESNKYSNTHNDRDDERNQNMNKKDHSSEDINSRHEQKRLREGQNSRPEFKSVVKGQVDRKDNLENGTTEEETPSSVYEEHTENSVSSAEKTQENIQGEHRGSAGSEEDVEEEVPAPFQFRAQEESYPDVDENKVTADNNQEGHRLSEEHENLDNSSIKPIIRREGNKLFTFVEAPEYAEYHEEMAKAIKEKSPDDFFII